MNSREYSSKKGTGPEKNWRERKAERKKKLEDETAGMIVNETAGNEASICRTLDMIDFDHSKLPPRVLALKTEPDQPYCDLEMQVRYLTQELRNHPQIIKTDIREIDKQLARLSVLLRQAVEQGNETAAYAAKAALVAGIERIRFKVPENQPEFIRGFVELNAKYLDEWVTLVGIAQSIDEGRRNCEIRRARVQEDQKAAEEERSRLRGRLLDDPAYTNELTKMLQNDSPTDRLSWTPLQREIFEAMIAGKMKSVTADLNALLLSNMENHLTVKETQKETLYAKLMTVPVFEDPNLLNKFKESVDGLFVELSRFDVELDEALTMMDDISGRIQQFAFTRGAVKAREIAVDQAEKVIKEIKQDQAREVDTAPHLKQLADLGILTDQQINKIKSLTQENSIQTESQPERLYITES